MNEGDLTELHNGRLLPDHSVGMIQSVRPYEYLRRAWHSEAHAALRGQTLRRIVKSVIEPHACTSRFVLRRLEHYTTWIKSFFNSGCLGDNPLLLLTPVPVSFRQDAYPHA